MAIEIEKGVPLPCKVSRRIYPFDKMVVGDSFLVELKEGADSIPQKQKVYLAKWRFQQVYPERKFQTASCQNAVRVWRIK